MRILPPGTEREIELPQGWTVADNSALMTVVGPERDVHIQFVDLPAQETAQETALAAWHVSRQDFDAPVLRESRLPAERGWETTTQIVYSIPAAESRLALAVIRTLHGRAYINLITGTKSAFSRRDAQIAEIMVAWKPGGLQAVSLADQSAKAWSREHAQQLREFVDAAMPPMGIPGTAIAIVQNGRVVYAEGFGVRKIGSRDAVTPQTRFMIGSSTKPLTSLMMACLIERGYFTWETPVVDVLKEFALADEEVTRKLRMRHTVCACTGMPRRDIDFIFKYAGITPEQRIAEMRSMRPTTGFGETFQYSNYLVAAGGYAAAHAFAPGESLEKAYERAMRELIFQPLGMSDTSLRQEDACTGEAAYPHATNLEGKSREIPLEIEKTVYSVAPAGAAWSTVLDIAKYLLLELNVGKTSEGEPLLSRDAIMRRRQPEIKIVEDFSYGLGLMVREKQGVASVEHGGNTIGFSSDMYFLPTKNIGVVVLTNLNGANFFLAAVREKIFEILFGAEAKASQMVKDAVASRNESLAKVRGRLTRDADALQLMEAMVGDYWCPELGPARIEKSDGEYRVQFESWGSDLGVEAEPNGSRLLVLTSPPFGGGFRFQITKDLGGLLLDAGQITYTFARQT